MDKLQSLSSPDVHQNMQMLSAQMMTHPKVYLSRATESSNDDNSVTERTQQYLQKFVDDLVVFVGSNGA